jgi:hypothetical protein
MASAANVVSGNPNETICGHERRSGVMSNSIPGTIPNTVPAGRPTGSQARLGQFSPQPKMVFGMRPE